MNASVNQCMANLRRAFKLRLENDPPLAINTPTFPMFEEDNVRHGLLT